MDTVNTIHAEYGETENPIGIAAKWCDLAVSFDIPTVTTLQQSVKRCSKRLTWSAAPCQLCATPIQQIQWRNPFGMPFSSWLNVRIVLHRNHIINDARVWWCDDDSAMTNAEEREKKIKIPPITFEFNFNFGFYFQLSAICSSFSALAAEERCCFDVQFFDYFQSDWALFIEISLPLFVAN